MQDKNKSEHHSLVPGDGTQNRNTKSADANWFGKSNEPQEEFAKDRPGRTLDDPEQGQKSEGQLSEGSPTISGREK